MEAPPSLIWLALAVVGLLVGPLLLRSKVRGAGWRAALDGFTLVTVGGLAILHLVPEAIAHGGVVALAFVGAGALLPVFVERRAARAGAGIAALVLLVGLTPHAALEAAALGLAPADQLFSLGAAVTAHRVPVGLIVFATVAHRYGGPAAWAAVALLAGATALGFWAGGVLAPVLAGQGLDWLQAMVGGSLLHVVVAHRLHADAQADAECLDDHAHHHDHHHHPDEHDHHRHDHEHESGLWPTLGALAGCGVLAVALAAVHDHGPEHGGGFGEAFLHLALECAPALLIGLALAGVVGVSLRAPRLGGGGPLLEAARGVAAGLCGPVRPCGVLPRYTALLHQGAPAAAALGLLASAPALGLDAALVSLPLLGVELTAIRVGAAAALALALAVVVARFAPARSGVAVEPEPGGGGGGLRAGLRLGWGEIFDHTMPWVVAGLFLAAWAEPLLGPAPVEGLSPVGLVWVAALAAVPIYVCAVGATPIAAVAIHLGVGPGPALAFLLAGPITHQAIFGALERAHGRWAAAAYAGIAILGAAGVGLAVQAVGPSLGAEAHGHSGAHWVQQASAVALLILGVASVFRQGPRGVLAQLTHPLRAGGRSH